MTKVFIEDWIFTDGTKHYKVPFISTMYKDFKDFLDDTIKICYNKDKKVKEIDNHKKVIKIA